MAGGENDTTTDRIIGTCARRRTGSGTVHRRHTDQGIHGQKKQPIVHSTRLDEPEAWEDEKGYLHVRTGILSNMRQLAQTLWPVGSEMEVYYDPDDPGKSYVNAPVDNAVLCRVFLIAGAGIVALGVLLYFLILNG